MQDNTITLAVDVLNNGTLVDKVFECATQLVDKSVYNGPGHTLISRNQMALTRSFPKRTGVYYGAAKSTIKFTLDVEVTQADGTTTIAPLIHEVSVSMPVGCPPAAMLAQRQHVVAVLKRDDVCDDLQAKLIV